MCNGDFLTLCDGDKGCSFDISDVLQAVALRVLPECFTMQYRFRNMESQFLLWPRVTADRPQRKIARLC